MDNLFEIGEKLYGFCNGYFGRDSYEDKIVEAFGKDWVVCRTEEGEVCMATFNIDRPIPTRLPASSKDYITFKTMISSWKIKDERF